MAHGDDSDDYRRTPTPPAVDMLSPEWQELREHERRINALEHDRAVLFGHRGQPGTLAVIGSRQDATDRSITRLDERMQPFERLRWQVLGAATLAGTIVSVAVLLLSKLWR